MRMNYEVCDVIGVHSIRNFKEGPETVLTEGLL